METKLQVFYNEESNVNIRMEEINNQPWFIAKDVCTALELSEVSNTVKRLDDDEKLTRIVFVSGQRREMWFVNESGLYNLIFQSRKPEARSFRKWVTCEVLPSIRRTGSYNGKPERPRLPLPKFRPFFDEWKGRVKPYISREELVSVALLLEVTLGHVQKVYAGTSVSGDVIREITEQAMKNRKRNILYPTPCPVCEQMCIQWDEERGACNNFKIRRKKDMNANSLGNTNFKPIPLLDRADNKEIASFQAYLRNIDPAELRNQLLNGCSVDASLSSLRQNDALNR